MEEAERSDIAPSEVESALARLLGREEFLANRYPTQFLKFVVEETLAGRGDRLKAYTIATVALKRGVNFDAQSDSIVRVQASRLRQLLTSYYAGPGIADPIRIDLPRGSYAPKFTRQAVSASRETNVAMTEAEIAQDEPGRDSAPRRPALPGRTKIGRVPLRRPVWIASAICLIILGAFAVSQVSQIISGRTGAGVAERNPITPVVVVQASDPGNQIASSSPLVQGVVNRIQTELSAFDNLAVRLPATEGANYMLDVDAGSVSERDFGVNFHLVYSRTSEIIWSRSFPLGSANNEEGQKEIADTVAAAIGDPYGVITSDFVQRLSQASDTPWAYRCVINAYHYIQSRNPDVRPDINSCLDKLVLVAGHNGRLLALRSIILVLGYLDATPDSNGVQDLERAARLANRAHDIEPARARSYFCLFLTRFYQKSYDDSFEAARRMLEANPNSDTMKAVIGVARISRGDFAEGEAILAPILRLERNAPRPYLAFAALAAYLKNDFETAWRIVGQRPQEYNAIGLLTKAMTCQQRQDRDCALLAAGQLRREFPAFASDLPASLERYAFSDMIKARIIDDLKTSGMIKNGAI